MGNFGFGEMAVIAIFGLLVFGPQRLPEIARSVGGFIREFKSVTGGITKEFKAEMDASPKPKPAPAATKVNQSAATDSVPGSIDPSPAHIPSEATAQKASAENVTTS